jgi:hypothetical protein
MMEYCPICDNEGYIITESSIRECVCQDDKRRK